MAQGKGLTPREKRRWIEALVSGEYEQGNGYLYEDGLYCCLGVECVVNGGFTIEEIWGKALGSEFNLGRDNLSIVVDENGSDDDRTIEDKLVQLNDEGVPFDLIAGLVLDPWNGRS